MEAIVSKVWGREEIICNEVRGMHTGAAYGYCGKRMVLVPGRRCSLHWHDRKDETFFVEHGRMRLEIAREPLPFLTRPPLERVPTLAVLELGPGQIVHILPGTLHRFSNLGFEDCVFFEFSTPDDPKDSFRVEPSGTIPR